MVYLSSVQGDVSYGEERVHRLLRGMRRRAQQQRGGMSMSARGKLFKLGHPKCLDCKKEVFHGEEYTMVQERFSKIRCEACSKRRKKK